MVVCDGVAFSRRPVAGLGEYGTVCGCQCGARSTTEGRLHRGFDYRRVVLGSSLVLRRERFRRTRYQRTGDGADVGSVPVRRGGAAAAGGRDSGRNERHRAQQRPDRRGADRRQYPLDGRTGAGARDAGLPLFGASGGALRLAPRSDRRSRPDRPAQPDAAGVCA